MTEQIESKAIETPSYLYPVRVELSQPIRRGGWKTSQVTYIVSSPQHVTYNNELLEIYRDCQADVKIPKPVLWYPCEFIIVPVDKIPTNSKMELSIMEGEWSMKSTVATWMSDTKVAYLAMNGELEVFDLPRS